jgi:hypothetical protein
MSGALPKSSLARMAETHATEVSDGWQRLEAGRARLVQLKDNELAEAEARSLALIRADTERALAHQAQTLRDAEKAAERASIERRNADLDATRAAELRTSLEEAARAAADERRRADEAATVANTTRMQASKRALAERQARLAAETEALAARRQLRLARLLRLWVSMRAMHPLVAAATALLLGILMTLAWVAVHPSIVLSPAGATVAPLQLETRLAEAPRGPALFSPAGGVLPGAGPAETPARR